VIVGAGVWSISTVEETAGGGGILARPPHTFAGPPLTIVLQQRRATHCTIHASHRSKVAALERQLLAAREQAAGAEARAAVAGEQATGTAAAAAEKVLGARFFSSFYLVRGGGVLNSSSLRLSLPLAHKITVLSPPPAIVPTTHASLPVAVSASSPRCCAACKH